MRLILSAAFSRLTGYGRDACDIAKYLDRAGVWVQPLCEIGVGPPVSPEVARLLTRMADPGSYDALLQFAPPFEFGPLDPDGSPAVWRAAADVVVGWSMWERDLLLPDDIVGPPDDRRPAWPGRGIEVGRWDPWFEVDLMLVTNHENAAAFRHLDRHVPIDVLMTGIEPDLWTFTRRNPRPSEPLHLGLCGVLNGRKGLYPFVDALGLAHRLRPDLNIEVEIKTQTHQLLPGSFMVPLTAKARCPVTVHSDVWTDEDMCAWYQSLDALVAPSTGEGVNKPALEMQATGGTVIATDMMGHHMWLHPAANYAIGGDWQPDKAGSPAQVFQPSVEALAETIIHCHDNRGEVAEKGRVAADWVRGIASWPDVIDRLLGHIDAAISGHVPAVGHPDPTDADLAAFAALTVTETVAP